MDGAVRPRLSISQISTLGATFADDVRAYAAAGLDGIGVWELKLGDGRDADALELLADSGLGSASAVPAIPSILPLPHLPGPEDPSERLEALAASLHRLAPFRPAAVVCLTGPAGSRDRDEALAIAIEGVRSLAREAELLDLTLALEPFQQIGIEDWSLVGTLDEAAAFVAEVGSPALGIQFDVWHLWNTPDLVGEIARHADLIAGVHVNDWREPTRGWGDRCLPGDGVADLGAILGALDAAGWSGFYDVEIFSDDGTFGNEYEDSLWRLDPETLARRARAAFERVWTSRRLPDPQVGSRN